MHSSLLEHHDVRVKRDWGSNFKSVVVPEVGHQSPNPVSKPRNQIIPVLFYIFFTTIGN